MLNDDLSPTGQSSSGALSEALVEASTDLMYVGDSICAFPGYLRMFSIFSGYAPLIYSNR